MDKQVFLREQFVALRAEANAIKARSFWIVTIGLIGIPLITYLAETSEQNQFLCPMIPYLVVVLLIMFLAEQNALMRAGRYVREHIEPHVDHTPGWENWLESNKMLRTMDRHFLAIFTLVFFTFFFMAIGLAIRTLWSEYEREPQIIGWVIAAVATYAIFGVWAVSTLLHHWRTCTQTSDQQRKQG